MDDFAYRLLQRALGNSDSACALEVTLNRLELELLERVRFAVTGRPGSILLDETPLDPGVVAEARAGSRVRIEPGRSGARSYVSWTGGIDAPARFGSRSVYAPLGFQALRAGEVLRAGGMRGVEPRSVVRARKVYLKEEVGLLRVVGEPPRGDWRVQPDSSRVGVRLAGGSRPAGAGEILSRPTVPGLVQLPPDGSAIVLGPDAPTIGGYASRACVISADLWKLGQLLPGDPVSFERVTLDTAARLGKSAAI